MNARAAAVQGHLLTLDDHECRHLLATAAVGRVAWSSRSGLLVLPVAYGVHADGRLGLHVASDSVLAELTMPTSCVFEVDDLDHTTAIGWSVLARGIARAWRGDFPAGLCRPWAPGGRTLGVQIDVDSCSGRSVGADWWGNE